MREGQPRINGTAESGYWFCLKDNIINKFFIELKPNNWKMSAFF